MILKPGVPLAAVMVAFSLCGRAQIQDTALTQRIVDAVHAAGLRGAMVGVRVTDRATGLTMVDLNGTAGLTPASNMKIVTGVAALGTLGPRFKFRTTCRTADPIGPGGTVEGPLYIVGGGDPVLTSVDVDMLARRAFAAGLRRVDGRILVDDSHFRGEPYGAGWSWDDVAFPYSAEISALNVDENIVTVSVRPGPDAGSAALVDAPQGIIVDSSVVTGPAGGTPVVEASRGTGSARVSLAGSVPARSAQPKTLSVTVHDPAILAAARFAAALKRAGVSLVNETPTRGRAPAAARELCAVESCDMREMVRRLNKSSDNLVAECMLREIGASNGVGKRSAEAGIEATRQWLQDHGIDAEGLYQVDGSGLSHMDIISPDILVRTLRLAPTLAGGDEYEASLPFAGVDGTLRRRMVGTNAAGNCHAKTGSLTHVSSLSGYVRTADGEPLVFSILVNNFVAGSPAATALQDRIVTLLADYRRGTSGTPR